MSLQLLACKRLLGELLGYILEVEHISVHFVGLGTITMGQDHSVVLSIGSATSRCSMRLIPSCTFFISCSGQTKGFGAFPRMHCMLALQFS